MTIKQQIVHFFLESIPLEVQIQRYYIVFICHHHHLNIIRDSKQKHDIKQSLNIKVAKNRV